MQGGPLLTAESDFEHFALFYAGITEFTAGTREFVETGLEFGEPVLVAVRAEKIEALRRALNGDARRVQFIDMGELGRNPGRIIPAVREWVDAQPRGRCRFIGEPIWPGRTDLEAIEATRHEALINMAFADAPATILCPYDTNGLDPAVVADAERTHPLLMHGADQWASGQYTDPLHFWRADQWRLSSPPPVADRVAIDRDLFSTRNFVHDRARAFGLGEARCDDLVLAANEAVTNALIHGAEPRELRIWQDGERIVCEVADAGHLEDPLTGRRRPRTDCVGGRGVWLINELCDLVELRPIDGGTRIRLHVELSPT